MRGHASGTRFTPCFIQPLLTAFLPADEDGRAEVQLITLGSLLQLEGKGENLTDINMEESVTHRIEGSGYPPFCFLLRRKKDG